MQESYLRKFTEESLRLAEPINFHISGPYEPMFLVNSYIKEASAIRKAIYHLKKGIY